VNILNLSVTKAKKGDLTSRRMVLKKLHKDAVQTLFNEIGPTFTDRPGGYTRIIKLGFRKSDSAAISLIELVGFEGSVEGLTASDSKADSE